MTRQIKPRLRFGKDLLYAWRTKIPYSCNYKANAPQKTYDPEKFSSCSDQNGNADQFIHRSTHDKNGGIRVNTELEHKYKPPSWTSRQSTKKKSWTKSVSEVDEYRKVT
jgi:hypothetical protein